MHIARAMKRYPLVNEARSPFAFRNGGRDLFEAMRDMRNLSMDTLAVYHSHPMSPPVPSRTDIEKNWGTGVMTLIVSLATTPPTLRGWWLEEAAFHEAKWDVE
jgi:proteasome lid subunit RPN8/RPN11